MASITTNPPHAKRQRTTLKPATIEGLKQKRAPPPIKIGILVLPAGFESACGILLNILQYLIVVLYVFIFLSTIGILAYRNTNKINLLIKYLIVLSISLEFFHLYIPNRSFEVNDLFENMIGVIVVIIIYKIKKKYE